jgi:hypothetical protein
VLVDQIVDNPYLSFVHWLSQFTLPWSLLFLGEWGEALRILAAEITLADKNGDRYRGRKGTVRTPHGLRVGHLTRGSTHGGFPCGRAVASGASPTNPKAAMVHMAVGACVMPTRNTWFDRTDQADVAAA